MYNDIGIEEKEAVMRVIESGCLSGYLANFSDSFYGGIEVRELEYEWSKKFNVKHCIAVNSATSGLWCAYAAIMHKDLVSSSRFLIQNNYKPGYLSQEAREKFFESYCFVSPYSMTCSATIPLHFKDIPIFVDIEPDYFCIDPALLEEKIIDMSRHGKSVKAIIVVDIFGQVYDADRINAIAKKYGIAVIEDAAQAIGARHSNGKYAGTLGDIGVFSLNVHKQIQCGEGGMVVTDNDDLALKIRLLMNHAEACCHDMERRYIKILPEYAYMVGMNMRMTEISAAIAKEQLKKLDGILNRVREHAKYFNVAVRPGCEHSYYRYAWKGDEQPYTMAERDKIKELFNVKEHYITPLNRIPLFRQLGYAHDECPICADVDSRIHLAWLKGMG